MTRDAIFVDVLTESVAMTLMVHGAPEVVVGKQRFRPGKLTLSVYPGEEHAYVGAESTISGAGHGWIIGGRHDESAGCPDWLLAIARAEIPRVRKFCERPAVAAC